MKDTWAVSNKHAAVTTCSDMHGQLLTDCEFILTVQWSGASKGARAPGIREYTLFEQYCELQMKMRPNQMP